MTVVALVKYGTYQRRLAAARRALKSWNYRLVRSRAVIVHENQTNAFAIVDPKTGQVVAGESVTSPRLSLSEVEDWYNEQEFVSKIASDGTPLRDVSPKTMSSAQRDIVARIALLPEEERLELVRYLSAQLLVRK
jgi:hypothetical protein